MGWNFLGKQSYKELRTYNANNQVVEYLSQNWEANNWENFYRTIFWYNPNGTEMVSTETGWENGAWQTNNASRITYSLNPSGNVISKLSEEMNSGSWGNISLRSFTYNTEEYLTSSVEQLWVGMWQNSERSDFNYNANDELIDVISYEWDGDQWLNYLQKVIDHSTNVGLTSTLTQGWNGTEWINNWSSTKTLNLNGAVESETYRQWTINADLIEFGDSTHYYYSSVTGVDELTQSVEELYVYPNPTTSSFIINYSGQNYNYSLYDPRGKLLMKEEIIGNSKTIDLLDRAPGIYTLVVQSDNGLFTQRIVRQ